MHRKATPVSKMDDKRTEWLRVVDVAELLNGHRGGIRAGNGIEATWSSVPKKSGYLSASHLSLSKLDATASIVDGALPSSRLFTKRNAGPRLRLAVSANFRSASRVAGLGSWVAAVRLKRLTAFS